MDTARVMGDALAEGVEPDVDPDHIADRKPGVEGERHMLRFQDLGLLGPARTETDGAFAAFQPRRIHHYDHPLSWSTGRPHPAVYFNYVAGRREFQAELDRVANVFERSLSAVRRRSGGRRSATCSARTTTTAPSVQDIRSRFAFATIMSPLPDQDDFRVSLNDDEVKHPSASTPRLSIACAWTRVGVPVREVMHPACDHQTLRDIQHSASPRWPMP